MSAVNLSPHVKDLSKLRATAMADRVRALSDTWSRSNGINADITSPGNPLKGVMPDMRAYPHEDMVTGSGSGPVIGRERVISNSSS